MIPGRTRPPRLVVRTTLAMFALVAFVLTAVLVLIAIQGSGYVRTAVERRLVSGQRMLAALEERQTHELQTQVSMLAENPTLKAAIDTYRAELTVGGGAPTTELVATIRRELDKLAVRIQPDSLAVTDPTGAVLAVAGSRRTAWPAAVPVTTDRGAAASQVLTVDGGVFRRVSAPIAIHDMHLGTLELATALDADYAARLAGLSGASTLIVSGPRVIASTLPAEAVQALTPAVLQALPAAQTVALGESEYALQLLFHPGPVGVYALESIKASQIALVADAFGAMIWVALAAFGIAAFASLWMARTLSSPIDRLSRSLTDMTRARAFDAALAPTGSSLEVDALIRSFNSMMESVSTAEAETQRAYVGAIRALAVALDARDPYTAGHSERVSAIAVAIGRQMAITPGELDVLRLGALLHDIGKIGISDNVLRKPDGLTPDEFEAIKNHPALGARIMRNVPFLAPHVPIVELHHERPDGRGYPYGLTSEATPILARIVHVADAFDAMTSARAYRPARPASEAVRELWRCAGTQFDADVVQALVRALPAIGSSAAPLEPAGEAALFAATRSIALVARA